MKKHGRLICLLLIFVMVFSLCVGSVFADSPASGADALVSSGDGVASGTDAIVSDADAVRDDISKLPLIKVDIEGMGFSMECPDFSSSFSPESSPEELNANFKENGMPTDLFGQSDYYGETRNYLYVGYSDNGTVGVQAYYTENDYTHYIGNYSDMDADRFQEIMSATILLDDSTSVEAREINGSLCMYQEILTQDNNDAYFDLQTIVNGGRYEVLVYVEDPSENDYEIARNMINSVKISGVSRAAYGVASTTAVIWLFVICGVLLVCVLFLIFFLVRFSMFATAAGSNFSVIGFNLPPRGVAAADSHTDDQN